MTAFASMSLNKKFSWSNGKMCNNTSFHLTLGKLQPPGVISWLVSGPACRGHHQQVTVMATELPRSGLRTSLSDGADDMNDREGIWNWPRPQHLCCLLLTCDAQHKMPLTGWNQNFCVQLSGISKSSACRGSVARLPV